MSDERALVAAIEAAQADDTLRLAYADRLDEHDHPGGPTFDFHDPRPMTPPVQAYLDHFRRK